jgi:hypothetical protein
VADLAGTRTIEIAASRERGFAIAADVDRVPEWHGAMTGVEVLLVDRPVEGLKARAEAAG